MRKSMKMLLAGAALAATAGVAQAQVPYGGGYGGWPVPGATPGWGGGADTAVLYEYPNFQGRSVVVTRENGNLDGVGFNDRARSARFEGTWRICEDANYRSRCETVSGAVPDLSRAGISGLSSLQMTGAGGGYPGYPGGGYGTPGQGVEGRSVIFYPGPVAAGGYGGNGGYGGYAGYGGGSRRTADDFCRRMGNSTSIYYDSAGGTLSDVLCRR